MSVNPNKVRPLLVAGRKALFMLFTAFMLFAQAVKGENNIPSPQDDFIELKKFMARINLKSLIERSKELFA